MIKPIGPKLKEILSSPEKWTKECFFRNENDEFVNTPVKATKCCIAGAMVKACDLQYWNEIPNTYLSIMCDAVHNVDKAFPRDSVSAFNDSSSTDFTKLHKVLDKYIELEAEHLALINGDNNEDARTASQKI